ncbi:orotidine-5'-phosphate decarboxylase [Neomicrococcus aestuarii]|uniref:Orotidine 5'-phosphate decarboxylase n=1 Tax=Neomicrococcus aestuarii TaxID=556325 RepID=A0A7W8TTZ1_9MICC|nr:orotidine-5'-phosphate decarboxylase [Neomicrococcus aestuarii]MBB5511993.1 orotidine-5'-phosphate decarboxylase [Neomicrococcus aestuarii]
MSETSGVKRASFGERLADAMATRGPLCVGIDPHPALLAQWGLSDDAAGLRTFSRAVLEATADIAATIKPQVALFERHGSRGIGVLEEVLAEARERGVLTIADAKRGDIGSTMQAYAEAWLADGSPLAADSLTVSPYLGFESLRPALDLAAETGRGIFVLALTSNPEGASLQHVGGQDSVARRITEAVAEENRRAAERAANTEGSGAGTSSSSTSGAVTMGSVGLVVGATVAGVARDLGIDLPGTNAPLLAPGLGAQGATPVAMRQDFGAAWPLVLANSSRGILKAGPSVESLRASALETIASLTQ